MVAQPEAGVKGDGTMRGSIVAAVLVALVASGEVRAQARVVTQAVTDEQVGSWVLTCRTDPMTDRSDCTLRHKLWLEMPDMQRPGSYGVAFEVILRDALALPAVTARGLSLSDPQRGALVVGGAAEIRFDTDPAMVMPCELEGRDAICLPDGAEARDGASAALLEAKRVLVRLKAPARAVTGGGSDDVLALDLTDTAKAIEVLRERAAGQPPRPPAPSATSSFLEQLERMLRR